MTKLCFSEMGTSSDYYIVEWEELNIESQLLSAEKVETQSTIDPEVTEAQKAALREIDRLKGNGICEIERARLMDLIIPTSNINIPKFDPNFTARLENFTAGLRSPDPEQRARFQKFSDNFNLGQKLPRDIGDYLWALEPVAEDKRKRGRPKINVPWAKVVWALDEMRVLEANVSEKRLMRLAKKKRPDVEFACYAGAIRLAIRKKDKPPKAANSKGRVAGNGTGEGASTRSSDERLKYSVAEPMLEVKPISATLAKSARLSVVGSASLLKADEVRSTKLIKMRLLKSEFRL